MDSIAVYTVSLSKAALKELRGIYNYLAVEQSNPFAAKRLLAKIDKKIISLEHFPASFAVYEPNPNWHIVHVKSYKILYRINEPKREVVITHILHSAQNF